MGSKLHPLEDKDFIKLVRKNKDQAFQHLVSSYSERVYNTCIQMLRNREDTEDLVQEVFTSIYLSIDSFEGKSKLSTWIHSIALNKSREFIRNKTRQKRSGIHTTLERDDSHIVPIRTIDFYHPGVQLEDQERAKILFDAIDQLADQQRQAYLLNKVEGYSYAETAELLETSVSSVESLLFRAKKRLKELLSDYYEKNK